MFHITKNSELNSLGLVLHNDSKVVGCVPFLNHTQCDCCSGHHQLLLLIHCAQIAGRRKIRIEDTG